VSKHRSPHCPQIALADALTKARRVYEHEHTHPADRKVIAEDLGYSGLSGPAASLIGALRQYGIIEDAGDGMRISEDAVAVFELPESSPERAEALQRLAYKPILFQELRNQFGDRLPGEANLRHLLIRKGFAPKAADEVLKSFRENFELVGTPPAEYNEHVKTIVPSTELYVSPETAAKLMPGQTARRIQSYSFALSPESKVELTFHGEITKDALQSLKDYIAITIRALTGLKKTDMGA
jgi:hypothetical protein